MNPNIYNDQIPTEDNSLLVQIDLDKDQSLQSIIDELWNDISRKGDRTITLFMCSTDVSYRDKQLLLLRHLDHYLRQNDKLKYNIILRGSFSYALLYLLLVNDNVFVTNGVEIQYEKRELHRVLETISTAPPSTMQSFLLKHLDNLFKERIVLDVDDLLIAKFNLKRYN